MAVVFAIAMRLWAGSLDRTRIHEYVEERGGTVSSITWQPLGRGWFGEKGERIYEVVYSTAEGDVRRTTCKTSMLSGVYFTDESVISRAVEPPRKEDDEMALLREENARLRAELEQLRGRNMPEA